MILTVRREALTPCCYGTMAVDGGPFGFTLERPWLDNQNNVSAIRAGTYTVAITFSSRFKKDMLEILHVQGRLGIRIHGANFWHELEGCIAVARKRISDEQIWGSLVPDLMKRVEAALGRGEAVKILILDPA